MPMDVRASDAERDAAVDQLREAAAEGRLTFEELSDRIEAAAAATTRGELVRLTRDLPAPLPASAAEPLKLRTVGDIQRSGGWVVPAELDVRSWLGSVTLDLRDARLTVTEVHIRVRTLGTIDLLVPEGVEVDVQARTRFGKLKQENHAASPGAPRVVRTGRAWGDIKIRHKRLWEKLLKGGR
jgi:hypothetical protein